jgi:alkanesulfonate monooxygenase SsuD/methylene tetrahydromethanopterin reductase-like flavin-dependent oxidoreductase (luciferase family)
VLCLLSVSDEDPTAARQHIGKWLAPMLASMSKSPQLTSSQAGREFAAMVAEVGRDALAAGPPDELLGEFVAAGTTTDCATTVQRLLAAGADRVILVPNPAGYRSTAEMVGQMRRAAPLVTLA